jgi:hypothetical protein
MGSEDVEDPPREGWGCDVGFTIWLKLFGGFVLGFMDKDDADGLSL